jgi:hypothetical protein
MIAATTEPRSPRPRKAALSLPIVTIAAIYALLSNSALAALESTTARDCAEWVNEAFFSPSPARDEAFVDCIIERDSSDVRTDLLQSVDAAKHDPAHRGSKIDENLPISPVEDCPYLRVAVQSPVGSDEVYQKPMRDLFSAALTRAGFEVVNADASHYWWASILAMETGPNTAVWTILVRAVPEIGDGAIQFTTVRRAVNGREGAFSGMQSLRAFSKAEAPEAAMLAAAGIATELLPAAYHRCAHIDSNVDSALAEAGIRLEELQKELAEEIVRVRREKVEREKASRQKQLAIEVEG